jgi:hypothetical protein
VDAIDSKDWCCALPTQGVGTNLQVTSQLAEDAHLIYSGAMEHGRAVLFFTASQKPSGPWKSSLSLLYYGPQSGANTGLWATVLWSRRPEPFTFRASRPSLLRTWKMPRNLGGRDRQSVQVDGAFRNS